MSFNWRCCVVLFALAVLAATFALADPAFSAAPPEVVTVVTDDGVQLRVTYFPSSLRKGTDEAKQVTPVLMLHDQKESRAVFNPLAQRLTSIADPKQKKGPAFAALTADLRAHGDSTKQVFPNGAQGALDASKLNKQMLQGMATFDMEALRSFLVEKNDAGELNLNKLCIVGAGMGASVAANWSLADWRAPPLAIGKQGQDVKALVLISPKWSYNGLSFQLPMRFAPLKQNVAWMLIYGQQDPKMRPDIERIEKQLAKFHPEQTAGAGRTPSSLQVVGIQSKLQGGTLLKSGGQAMEQQIIDFLVTHVAKNPLPWSNRLDRVPRE
jgi:pimeloyl-ACP methyl ester carboxylesterase